MVNRRSLLKTFALSPLISPLNLTAANLSNQINTKTKLISLSQWSFHRAILGNSKENYKTFLRILHTNPDKVLQGSLDSRDICKVSRSLGTNYIDLVNVLFFGHAMDKPWLNDFKHRANDQAVQFQLLMCDQAGSLGASSISERKKSVESHLPWFETAAYLNCKQVRVNAYGDGSYLQQLEQCAESLSTLAEIAGSMGLELLVENHGYASNNGAWLAMLMEHTNHKNLGVFTDLDNFFMGGWNISPERRYDRTQGLIDLAPYTRGVSVKSHHFSANGQETTIDYQHCFSLIKNAGFDGFYSAEFEGNKLSELDGSIATIQAIRDAHT